MTSGADGAFDRSAWFNAKPGLAEKNALMNLPHLIDGDLVVSQSNSCMQYLDKKLGFVTSLEQETLCNQVLCEVMDFRNACVGVWYGTYP